MSKLKRKKRRRAKLDAWKESTAARSKYAAKKFERENGRAPRKDAYSEARKHDSGNC